MAQGGENENNQVDETLENEKIKLGNAWLQLANRISDSEKSSKKTLKVDEKQGKIIRQNYQKNKGNIKGKVKTQIRELKELKNFPNDINDIEAMYKWVKDNSDAIEFLNNDELRSIINDKEIDAAYKQTIEIRKNVSRWIGIYDVDYLRPIKAKEEREEDLKKFAEIDNKNITQEKKNEEKEEIRTKRAKEERERVTRGEQLKKPLREEMKNMKEYSSLGIFAEKLSEAGNAHDKNDYKQLIKMLTNISKGYSTQELYPDDWGTMSKKTEAQRKALPYFRVKEQIEKYIAHKAKDGVKAKDLKKLAAVEELNQYVSKRIKELQPEPFKLGNTTYNKDDICETYSEEFEIASSKNPGLCNTSSNDSLYNEIADGYNKLNKGKSYVDPDILKNASSCMDRIMLKVQINRKDLISRIPDNLGYGERTDIIKQNILKDFTKVKDVLVDSPIKTKNAPVKEKQNNNLGIGI